VSSFTPILILYSIILASLCSLSHSKKYCVMLELQLMLSGNK
jgi:hypothetical protein